MSGATSPFLTLVGQPNPLGALHDLIKQHHTGHPADLHRPVRDGAAIKRSKTFGVVITCHNNAATIADAVLSCLNQSLPFDEIVVVNDRSTDASNQILAELADLYSSIRLVDLPSNLGPSAARDLGLRRLSTDFFTQLDGDDLFWPTKNACEAAAIAGDEEKVAFSDILLVHHARSGVQSTAAYDGKTGREAFELLLSRTAQIPRDMTLSRKLYFEVGGYNPSLRLYEDWDFKMRLAARSTAWVRADGVAGTVYSRLSPGLSGVDDPQHARALVQIFLRALANSHGQADALLAAFDQAVGRFKTDTVVIQARAALQAVLRRPDADLRALVALASRRDLSALDNLAFGKALDAFTTASVQTDSVT